MGGLCTKKQTEETFKWDELDDVSNRNDPEMTKKDIADVHAVFILLSDKGLFHELQTKLWTKMVDIDNGSVFSHFKYLVKLMHAEDQGPSESRTSLGYADSQPSVNQSQANVDPQRRYTLFQRMAQKVIRQNTKTPVGQSLSAPRNAHGKSSSLTHNHHFGASKEIRASSATSVISQSSPKPSSQTSLKSPNPSPNPSPNASPKPSPNPSPKPSPKSSPKPLTKQKGRRSSSPTDLTSLPSSKKSSAQSSASSVASRKGKNVNRNSQNTNTQLKRQTRSSSPAFTLDRLPVLPGDHLPASADPVSPGSISKCHAMSHDRNVCRECSSVEESQSHSDRRERPHWPCVDRSGNAVDRVWHFHENPQGRMEAHKRSIWTVDTQGHRNNPRGLSFKDHIDGLYKVVENLAEILDSGEEEAFVERLTQLRRQHEDLLAPVTKEHFRLMLSSLEKVFADVLGKVYKMKHQRSMVLYLSRIYFHMTPPNVHIDT